MNQMRIKPFYFIVLTASVLYSCTKINYVPPINPINNWTVTDTDGNVYHTVTIGTQTWMVENLKTTKFCDGTPIPNVTKATNWAGLTTGIYCDYNNTPSNSDTYGRLYNWYAVANSVSICPRGWHIPTLAEWQTLGACLHGSGYAGGEMKEAGNAHWLSPNEGATNQSGFTALPAGTRGPDGSFGGPGYVPGSFAAWWTATVYDPNDAWDATMDNTDTELYNYYGSKAGGLSVRCVKD